MSEATDTSPMISVIIPTRDRADHLARCLPTILANDYPTFDIIVVDQSTTDGGQPTAAFVDPRLRYQRQNARGKSRALNQALTQAKGEVIAFTDDDCTVPHDWLSRGVGRLAAAPDAGIICGKLVAAPHNPQDEFVPTFLPSSYRRLYGRLAAAQPRMGVGANMFVRRRVFERLVGFDECLGPGSCFRSGDDVDLTYRALRAGFTVLQDPDNSVVHWGRRAYADGSAQRLLRNNYYGAGARLMKQLRCGDSVAAYALLQLALRDTVHLAGNLIRLRRQAGAARLLYLALGVVRGLRQPIDRQHWLFVPGGHERA